MKPFRLGTRGSPLALVQANMVRDALAAAHGWGADAVEIVTIRTTGDRVQDRPLAEIGGKALWTRELDVALIDGEVDCTVHSMKDVETFRPAGIAIAAILPRADVRDRIIGADSVEALPQGARVGTSSPRRAAQLRRLRPDLRIVMFRGNVDTRLAKLAAGEADATLLAAAGLDRLGRDAGTPVPIETMLPAPAQGAVGIEARTGDAHARALLAAIDDPLTHACVGAERALLAALHADCHSPMGALATLEGAILTLRAELLSEDGSFHVHAQEAGAPGDPALPETVARDLLDRAPPDTPAVRAMSRTIAVLRPEPGNRVTAAAIEACGRRAIRLPLFEIVPVGWTLPDPADFDALIVTSANALRHGGAGLSALLALPVHAVGEATAAAARRAGFAVAAVGDAGSEALIAAAEAAGVLRALHLAGRERSVEPGGIVAEVVTVYASEPLPVSPSDAARLEGCVAIVQSSRAAQRLGELVDGAGIARAGIALVAVSARAATAAGEGWERVVVPPAVTGDALVAAALAD